MSNTVFSDWFKKDGFQDVLGVPWVSDSNPRIPGPFVTVMINNIVLDLLHFLPSYSIIESQT